MNDSELITVELIQKIQSYLKLKTGKLYFKNIRKMSDNILLTCPFHKDGQENRPSATIRITASDKASPGLFNCFNCHEAMMIDEMVAKILGDLYDAQEVENILGLKAIRAKSSFIQPKKEILFNIPLSPNIRQDDILLQKFYHPYLASRGITEEVANIYDIGYDKFNNQITFPIYDILHNCVGIGRRDITFKRYIYPYHMIKPLYGLYELDPFLNYVYVCEGPFNLWSLRGWGKQGVALLGTGTEFQYNQLLQINCKGFVLGLDPDEAGIRGNLKLGHFLINNNKKVFVACLPFGKDINDLSQEEFRNIPVEEFLYWSKKFK